MPEVILNSDRPFTVRRRGYVPVQKGEAILNDLPEKYGVFIIDKRHMLLCKKDSIPII